MNKQIIIDIDTEGNSKVETKGFFGSACKMASKFLEALGVVTRDTATTEMYQQQAQAREVRQ